MCKLLCMSNDDYQKALDTATAELQELFRQKDEIEKRIAKLRQTVASLSALNKDDESEEDETVHIPSQMQRNAAMVVNTVAAAMAGRIIGFTDAVREVLKASGDYMTPLEVKDGLLRMGINLEAKYSNPLAVIHTTLKRLHENIEVSKRTDKHGNTTYRWGASMPAGHVEINRAIRGGRIQSRGQIDSDTEDIKKGLILAEEEDINLQAKKRKK